MVDELIIPEKLNTLHQQLQTFVKESTKHFDDSHNDQHMYQVVKNAFAILNRSMADPAEVDARSKLDQYPDIPRLILLVAWLHDVRDHKYPESISEEAFTSYLISVASSPEEALHIQEVIENISFSKEAKGLRKQLIEPYQTVLEIVGDADRLEAIGAIGIQRCETFTREHGGQVPKDVIIHCHEKLLRLLPDGFIKTKKGREMALPLHQEILEYVQKHEANHTSL